MQFTHNDFLPKWLSAAGLRSPRGCSLLVKPPVREQRRTWCSVQFSKSAAGKIQTPYISLWHLQSNILPTCACLSSICTHCTASFNNISPPDSQIVQFVSKPVETDRRREANEWRPCAVSHMNEWQHMIYPQYYGFCFSGLLGAIFRHSRLPYD